MDKSVKNVSLSGQSLQSIVTLLARAIVKDNEQVNSVIHVVHLGTNDMVGLKPDEVMDNGKTALNKVQCTFPGIPVAFSSILPRRGKSATKKNLNEKHKTGKQIST